MHGLMGKPVRGHEMRGKHLKPPSITATGPNKSVGNVPAINKDQVMQKLRRLQPTSWLAEKLGLSLSTIEKLRAQGSDDLPPYLIIGGSIRYSDLDVDAWIEERLKAAKPTAPTSEPGGSDEQ